VVPNISSPSSAVKTNSESRPMRVQLRPVSAFKLIEVRRLTQEDHLENRLELIPIGKGLQMIRPSLQPLTALSFIVVQIIRPLNTLS